MSFRVVMVRDVDDRETAKEHDHLTDAVSFALALADEIGKSTASADAAIRKIEIHSRDRMEIAVHVVRGGLESAR